MGIMVGRGNSPVTFDTQGFQKRLETIANEFGEKKDIPKKMDLKFYDALDSPVQEESVLSKKKPLEIMPKKEIPVKEIFVKETLEKEILEKETRVVSDILPLKKSRKKLTFKKMTLKAKTDIEANGIPKIKLPKIKQGKYTIQIAAYKEFKDAITQMARLEEKGFSSYRVKGGKDGATWYRVRIGSFASWDEAQKIIEKLNSAGIKAQIVEKGL